MVAASSLVSLYDANTDYWHIINSFYLAEKLVSSDRDYPAY